MPKDESLPLRPKADFSDYTTDRSHRFKKLAHDFIHERPMYVFATGRDDSGRGIWYKYEKGVYKAIAEFELIDDIGTTLPVAKSMPRPRVREIVQNLKPKVYCYHDEFNRDNVINFRNGLFNVDSRIFSAHTPEYLSSIQLPYEYDVKADCPLWKKTILDICESDLEKVHILQEFMGYCFTRETKFEKALFLIGESNSGKSTILDTIKAIVGKENHSAVSMKYINKPEYMGVLMKSYVNLVSEIPKKVGDYEEMFKMITTGESVTVNTKFIAQYTDTPFCKLIFAGNRLMHISDSSDGTFNRILLLELDNVIPASRMDRDLKKKLAKEAPGIFNWALDGLNRLNVKKDFTQSTLMNQRIAELKIANNPILFFCDEKIETSHNKTAHYITKQDLYNEYRKFCSEYSIKGIVNIKNFNEEIWRKYRGKTMRDQRKTVNGKQVRIWNGLKYKEPHKEKIHWEE